MNEDVLKGLWKQARGEVKKRWGQLTNDELDQIEGESDLLVGKIQEKYGYTRDRAEQEVNEFLREMKNY